MDTNSSNMIAVTLLAYSSTVMRHFAMANYDITTRAFTIPDALRGGIPTLLAVLFVPIFFWLPVYLYMKEGPWGLAIWLSSLVVTWLLALALGLRKLLFFHFCAAICAAALGTYLSVTTL
jgi:hypothetical protein